MDISSRLCFDIKTEPYPRQRWVPYRFPGDDTIVCWFPGPYILADCEEIPVVWWNIAFDAEGAPSRGEIRALLGQYWVPAPKNRTRSSLVIALVLAHRRAMVSYTDFSSDAYWENDGANPVKWRSFSSPDDSMDFVNSWIDDAERSFSV